MTKKLKMKRRESQVMKKVEKTRLISKNLRVCSQSMRRRRRMMIMMSMERMGKRGNPIEGRSPRRALHLRYSNNKERKKVKKKKRTFKILNQTQNKILSPRMKSTKQK